jgi:hypothetical protein
MTIEQFLLIATGLNLVFVLLGFLLKPGGYGGWGWSFGAIVALAAAVVAFLPLGRPFIQAQRRR